MRNNTIGKIRKDLDELVASNTKLSNRLNIITCVVIFYIAANFLTAVI
jgi:hypothetical protein